VSTLKVLLGIYGTDEVTSIFAVIVSHESFLEQFAAMLVPSIFDTSLLISSHFQILFEGICRDISLSYESPLWGSQETCS
jgi:hypothetical protein